MTRTILYYPHINIQNQNWIKQAVLFWDRVGTIIPREVERRYGLPETFRILEERGLFRTFYPEEHVEKGEQLTEEFIQIQTDQSYSDLKQKLGHPRKRYSVYKWKIPDSLRQYIQENQLAEDDPIENDRLRFHYIDGLLYMSLLAKYLADQDWEEATTPGTDYGLYQNLALGTELNTNQIPAISFSLKNVLPMPSDETTLEQILAFRENHHNDLLRFRTVLSKFQTALSKATTNGELQNTITGFKEAIEVIVNDLEDALEDASIATNQGTLDGVVLQGVEILEGVVEGITNPFTPGRKALERGLEIKQERVNAINAERQTLRRNAYSYIFHAEQAGIL